VSFVTLGTLSRRRRLGRALGRVPAIGIVAAVVIGTLALIALVGSVIAPSDPNAVDILNANSGLSAAHLLGTDSAGRDLLSRLIVGSQTALLGPLFIVLFAGILGSAIAIGSAWIGGRFDGVVVRLLDVMFAFPGILLALVAAAVFSPSLASGVIALSIAYVPYTARIVRGEALRQRSQPYVEALEVQGVSGLGICLRHLLPNVAPMIMTQVTIAFGAAVVDMAALSFLGLGVQPPKADWGQMVASGKPGLLRGFPQESVYAAVLLVLAVVAFTALGDRLAERSEEAV
jgi:peptide/nickel transport system permease protein